ncbi:MAG TPA: DUF4905 domain-containing protein [Pelobium sp.]|nr:DUF4905 domain-containing protein [Pelobium sp.]
MNTNKDTLKLAYSTKCEGIIWKIILDENNEIIVWECRTKNKKVAFYAYDFKNQHSLLNNFKFQDDWELSIHTVKDGVLYLNGHESDFSPVQKGIVAFDLIDKKILWQNFSISAQLFSNDGIIVFDSRILPRKYRMISAKNGQDMMDIDLQSLAQAIPLSNKIILPKMMEAEDIINTTHQLIYDGLKITSYYLQNGNAIDQYIKAEKDDEILIDEILNDQIQKISFDTFFVWQNKLVYIKNKTEIVSYFVSLQNF